MRTVETLTGPVPAQELGKTLVHEHLRTAREPVYVQFPHLDQAPQALARVVDQVRRAQAKGVKTIVDPTVLGLDRRITFARDVVEATGLQVVAGTGTYIYEALPPYFAQRPAEALAEAFVHDIEVGIQGTSIKAAFLKCATDVAGVTPDVAKVLRATALAHLRTGVPIMTHTHAGNRSGLDQLKAFVAEGVRPDKVIIGHSGDTEDLDYLRSMAEQGALLGMDRFGMDDFLPTERRLAVVAQLVRDGFAEKIVLSQDYVCELDYEFPTPIASKRGDWRLDFVVDEVVPRLNEQYGVDQDLLDQMLTRNVHQWIEPVDRQL